MQASEIEKFPLPEEPKPMPWYRVWWQVLTRPRVESYRQVLRSYHKGTKIQYLWVVVVGLISILIVVPLYLLGMQSVIGEPLFAGGRLFIPLLCLLIFAPFAMIIGLVIMTGASHLVAKSVFHGSGTYSELEYLYGAATALYSLIGGIFSILTVGLYLPQFLSSSQTVFRGIGSNEILLFSCCISIFSMVVGVYYYLIQVVAVQAVYAIEWWKALISALWLPVFFMLCGVCLYAFSIATLVSNSIQ